MAKGKKSKKDVESESEDEVVVAEEQAKKPKKDKKKKDAKSLETAMENLDMEDSEPEVKPAKKEKKKKKKDVASDSEDDGGRSNKKGGFALLMDDDSPDEKSEPEEEAPQPVKSKSKKSKSKSAFELLQNESEEEVDKDMEEEEVIKPQKDKKKKKKKQQEIEEDESIPVEEAPKEEKGGKKKKKKKGKKDDEDEDLDAMLAALKAEYTGEAPPEETEAPKAPVNDEKEGKKKKNKKGDEEDAGDMGFEVIDGEEVGGTVKTAAQKKKEKKERQKQKEFEEKKKAAENKGKPKEAVVEKAETPKLEEKDAEEPEGEEDVDDTTGDKTSKKKKGKKDEEDKKKKKPNKAVLAAMQEALQKQKDEEEERLRKEQEEQKAWEEKIRLEEEQKKRDEEKKLAKKEREKQRKAELKAAGKLLTPAQKQAKARAEALLEARRAQGLDVPEVGEKRVRPGMKKRFNQKKQQEKEKESTPEGEKESTPEEVSEVKESPVEEKKEEVADSWDAEDDIKDAWDADSDKEEEKKKEDKKTEPVAVVEKQPSVDEEKEESEEEESDEEDDESDESEDEESEDDSDESEDDSEEDMTLAEKKRERALARIAERKKVNESNRTTDELRAPVVCVLGHVDTGKTKILDKLRRTNVQDGEAGGITQQIGATNVPIAVIQEQCKMVHGFVDSPLKLPGLLIIDTPGHESFSNLRDRGSSLCDIAILVVDIMHGLEPQTIESLNLLKKKKTPFVVALNKIDRLYEWKGNRHKDVRDVLKSQPHNTMMEFQKRKDEVILGLAEQGMNAALFWENPDPSDYISLVPTSAHSGDGMGNLMGQLVEMSQTFLSQRLSFTEELQATVLEVKAIGGFGTTIDVVLVNGRLKFGQTIVLTGTEGPIVTTVKALLTPSKMQDLRVKNQYLEHKELKAAQGVKIAAKELEKTIAGLSLRVAYNPDEVDIVKAEAEKDLASALNAIKLKPLGVFVQASTLGSLEALLDFLKTSKIPYAGVRIGPVVRKDVMRASTMLEHEQKYAVILAFDVKVERDAQEMADREGVKIFQADIIYHLFDRFTEYQAELVRQKKEQFKHVAVFPCKLRIMAENVFRTRDPIVCGVKVEAGVVRIGTPICVPSKEFIYLGAISSIEHNNKEMESAKKGDEICIKIENPGGDAPKMFGRHFDATDLLISKISRESIDACKDYFRDELVKSDWALMVELKKLFEIL